MNDFINKNRGMLGGVALIVACAAVYFLFFSGGSSSAPALSSSDQTSPVSQNLLATLQNLHAIKLDDTVFQDPVFTSLTDFGVIIPPEDNGRRNPFIPLTGLDVNASLTIPGGTQ